MNRMVTMLWVAIWIDAVNIQERLDFWDVSPDEWAKDRSTSTKYFFVHAKPKHMKRKKKSPYWKRDSKKHKDVRANISDMLVNMRECGCMVPLYNMLWTSYIGIPYGLASLHFSTVIRCINRLGMCHESVICWYTLCSSLHCIPNLLILYSAHKSWL